MTVQELIKQLQAQRKEHHDAMVALAAKMESEKRVLTEVENTDWTTHRSAIDELDNRIGELVLGEQKALEQAQAVAGLDPAAHTPRAYVRAEPTTYDQRVDVSRSFFRDLTLFQVRHDVEAGRRLQQHMQEVRTDLQRGALPALPEMERRALTRTDGAGGDFVPPIYLIDDFAALARAARPFADLFPNRPLPGGTDSINVPRVTSGTATGVQTADGAAVTSTDAVTDTINAPVRTIAGQQDLALQLIEQSPILFDEVIFSDLIGDYNTKVDVQGISGSGSSGQMLGALNLSGINTITYTDGTPTVPELYPKVADGIQQIHTGRFLPPQVIAMHPRRWGWHLASLDSQSRPLVVPDANGAYNALAKLTQIASENVVGSLQGVPVMVDASIPINLGGGTNEDRVIIARFTDSRLWEGALRSRALPEVLSGTLQVRLQVYAYVAFMCGRYPKSFSVVSGTGLVTPSF